MRTLISLLLLCTSTLSWAEMPSRIEANYDVLVKGIKLAEIREVFVRTDDQYHIESVTKPVGLLALFKPETIVVTSDGEIDDHGLRPLKFSHHRTHDSSMNNAAEFDWSHNEITHRDKSGISQMSLPVGTQDRLSMMYQFVAIPPHGKLDMKFSMSNGSNLEAMHYQLNPEQTINVPFGSMKSYYLYSLPRNIPKKSEVWLAVEHSYVPCKIVLTEDGSTRLEQVLTSLNIVP